jgi:hypothetical protein
MDLGGCRRGGGIAHMSLAGSNGHTSLRTAFGRGRFRCDRFARMALCGEMPTVLKQKRRGLARVGRSHVAVGPLGRDIPLPGRNLDIRKCT